MYGSISIHASAKEATLRLRKAGSHRGHFNPRLREGGDPFYRWSRPQNQHFNPRLREGGDEGFLSLNDYICISIHASAKEATTESALSAVVLTISIHASAKEATRELLIQHLLLVFQSTPPRRRRQGSLAAAEQSAKFQSTPPRRRRPQHIVIPQLSCTYLVSTTFLSTIFSFISQYVVLFFLF